MQCNVPCRIPVFPEGERTILATIGFEEILDSVNAERGQQDHFAALFEQIKGLMKIWEE